MSKVIVVTDSNSGITPDEAKKLGVEVIPMPFYIDEQMYYENIDLTQEQEMIISMETVMDAINDNELS